MQRLPATTESIAEAVRVLREGGVIVHATETCYGLACDLTNVAAVKKLFAIKDRPLEQPVSALFASVDEAKKYVEWNKKAEDLALKFLPGALTMILPLRSDVPFAIFPSPTGGTTVGVRVSSHPIADAIAVAFQKPMSTTSANPHGDSTPYNPDYIVQAFQKAAAKPDLLLDSGILPMNPPSTIINLATGAEGIIRTGKVLPM